MSKLTCYTLEPSKPVIKINLCRLRRERLSHRQQVIMVKGNDQQVVGVPKSLSNFIVPQVDGDQSSISSLSINDNNFELKFGIIQMV